MTKIGVCSRSARSNASAPNSKHSARILGQQQHVLRVAVRRVRARDEVRLLRARRHAGRRAAALHVEQHRRNLGEIGEPEEFLHQRNAGARRRGERARAVPRRADDHADRRQLVLGLHDRIALLARRRARRGASGTMLGEALGERRRRRDRIPRGNRRATVDGAQRGRGVAVDEDAVADGVAPRDRQADRAREVRERVIASEVKRLAVRFEQRFLAAVLLGEEALDHVGLDVEQRGQRAEIDDVLEQLPLPDVAVRRRCRSPSAARRAASTSSRNFDGGSGFVES